MSKAEEFNMVSGYVHLIWCPQDVKSIDPRVTNKEAQEILARVASRFEELVTESAWDYLRELIDDDKQKQKAKHDAKTN